MEYNPAHDPRVLQQCWAVIKVGQIDTRIAIDRTPISAIAFFWFFFACAATDGIFVLIVWPGVFVTEKENEKSMTTVRLSKRVAGRRVSTAVHSPPSCSPIIYTLFDNHLCAKNDPSHHAHPRYGRPEARACAHIHTQLPCTFPFLFL